MDSQIETGPPIQPPSCPVCGSKRVMIRGRYPKQEDRCVCPTCLAERMDQILDIAKPDYGQACEDKFPLPKSLQSV